MAGTSSRAVAILKAKSGREQALLDFTLEVLPQIRKVDGLQRVELSRSVSDAGQLLLYYWWESPEHSQQYVNGQVYARIAPRLEELVQEHLLVLAEVVEG